MIMAGRMNIGAANTACTMGCSGDHQARIPTTASEGTNCPLNGQRFQSAENMNSRTAGDPANSGLRSTQLSPVRNNYLDRAISRRKRHSLQEVCQSYSPLLQKARTELVENAFRRQIGQRFASPWESRCQLRPQCLKFAIPLPQYDTSASV